MFSSFFWFIIRLFLPILAILPFTSLQGQDYPPPELADTTGFDLHFSRTMHLLATSTPDNKNTVKILVYGQSISEQDWWLEVKNYLIENYPDANLIIENKSIGGFSSQILYKTVHMDVCAFNPDLVLFHVYGSDNHYEDIISEIKSHTVAEVGLQTDHYAGANDWSDNMSYNFIPEMAEKYGCELINIRDPWKQYLETNNKEYSELLKDGVHLNDHGNFLMAELIKPYLAYKNFHPDPQGLVTSYEVGQDITINNDTLKLSFSGNRVDVVFANEQITPSDSVYVFLDGHKPSEFQGNYYLTRPYNDQGDLWPWEMGSMVRVQHEVPLLVEKWTCEFTNISAPYESFDFSVSGSKTGIDGDGKRSETFISNSGRVIIEGGSVDDGGDWHVKRSHDVLGTETAMNSKVHWDVYTVSKDTLFPEHISESSIDNRITLFQGVANKDHELILVDANGNGSLPIKEIRVYRPSLDRTREF